MAGISNCSGGVFLEVLRAMPETGTIQRNATTVRCSGNKSDENQQLIQRPGASTSRRKMGMALLLSFGSVIGTSGINDKSLADDNGFWLNGPLPLPLVENSKYFQSSKDFV